MSTREVPQDRNLADLAAGYLDDPGPGPLRALQDWLIAFDVTQLDIPALFRTLEHPHSDSWAVEPLLDARPAAVRLFALPARSYMPLHDHPGMTVLMRVVAGQARITSWTRIDRATVARHGDRVVDAGSEVQVTEPLQGNVHDIRPLNDFAFIDLLIPPYAPENGRPCTFYRGQPTGAPSRLRLIATE